MKIVAISDTHGQHHNVVLPKGDVLIHTGDISSNGRTSQVVDFLQWFAAQPFEHKVFIAGNHDYYFERESPQEIQSIMPAGVTYLNDSGVIINGIKFWGSPIQPWFFDWAFNRQRGAEIKKHWDLIPNDTDVLLVHGPAKGILDRVVNGDTVGCVDLLEAVKRVKPQYFVFGHIHEAYGRELHQDTTYINASVLDVGYRLANAPMEFEV